MINLSQIATEQANPSTAHIDELSTLEMLKTINEEDHKVASSIEPALPVIAQVVDIIAQRLKNGGRLFYIGAGTSGRLGILDAVECPPTFGTNPELVQGIIAGGTPAIFKAVEGAEDSLELSRGDLNEYCFNDKDVLVGIAASGRTPYTLSAINYAKEIGATAVSLTCSPDSPMEKAADYAIVVQPGPEVITGSTRLKAGTAQKLVLNMLSTGTMIKLGKVYGHLMVDVKASNNKLTERATRIVMEVTDCDRETAVEALKEAKGKAKLAIFHIISGESIETSKKLLDESEGYIGMALKKLPKSDN
ncbi:N-acetylmuramic acid 6-phosphate etherase [Anaerovibrio sp. JC8]|uniref:N-acetylmuramic acid 6-phosphate etherase n=1 Tax=Anaerovibrio sp. JC8 TaxID=1240085 RepID=UPI000A0BB329|nr:N-acetylmuramic acid 6-phosphate etherase [Anaerovibrio sp. JC8]ORU00320.1 N-acetylmuramic acid 6-phosphate etherase [Anaerovibrio sp. JC8]